MKNYRKIWEKYNGPIPKDENGIPYDIHHIDGNRNNNDISNLKALSIKEHYQIHNSQGDWSACKLLAERLNITLEEKLEINKKMSGEGNPMFGKRGKDSPHYGKKRPEHSNAIKEWWKNNPNYDRGIKWRKKISDSHLGMVICKNEKNEILRVTKEEFDSNPNLVGITANIKINKSSKPIMCIEEDENFKSVKEASKYYNISQNLIYKSIRLGVAVGEKELGICGKLSFKYID